MNEKRKVIVFGDENGLEDARFPFEGEKFFDAENVLFKGDEEDAKEFCEDFVTKDGREWPYNVKEGFFDIVED